MLRYLLLVLSALIAVQGDIYMHNPRGSNNRLNERSANRNNANRCFDSQVSLLRQCPVDLMIGLIKAIVEHENSTGFNVISSATEIQENSRNGHKTSDFI